MGISVVRLRAELNCNTRAHMSQLTQIGKVAVVQCDWQPQEWLEAIGEHGGHRLPVGNCPHAALFPVPPAVILKVLHKVTQQTQT